MNLCLYTGAIINLFSVRYISGHSSYGINHSYKIKVFSISNNCASLPGNSALKRCRGVQTTVFFLAHLTGSSFLCGFLSPPVAQHILCGSSLFFSSSSSVPQVSREGDPFVSTSLEEAIRSIDSAIDSTRRQLFDG